MTSKNTYRIALSGICLALTMVFLFAALVVPGVELTLYAVSSLFIAVMMIESGLKGGLGLYAAAVLLGLLILPNKAGILPYACLFGLYGIIKYYIEKIRRPAGQLILKILFFAAVLTAGLNLFKGLLFGNIQLPDLPQGILLAGGIVFLLLYDLIYTLLIRIYRTRFRKRERIHFELSKEREEEDEKL
ncbi:hypothetical protein LI177_11505 [bacterium 210820-DFI.6.37]|nr:hypothetical protein [bacterium 210820-DFI.6.37]